MPDLTGLHESLARVVLRDRELVDVLGEITEIGRQTLPGAEAASVTLITGDEADTAAFRGRMAIDAEQLQYEQGHGPCLDAGRAGLVFVVRRHAHRATVARLRRAGRRARRAQLAVGPAALPGVDHRGAEPLRHRAGAFDEDDVARGEEVASFLAVAVANAQHSSRTAEEAAACGAPWRPRATIEQAKGILMERHKVTAELAFTALTRASQRADV